MDPDALSPTQRQALSQLQATNGGNAEYARGVLDGLLLSGMTAVAPITYDLANSLYAKAWGKPWPHQTVGAISMADISQNVEDASISFDGDGDGAMSLDGDDDNQWDYTVFHGIRSIMAACGAPKFGLDHDVLVIRPEYNLLLEYLEGVSVRGVVAIGHQGIGKTLSLIYLLLHRLEHRLPTAIQLGKVVVCFDDKGATTHDPNAERDLTGYWALTDSNHLITTPSSILMKSDLIVQTSSPQPERWKEWTKQLGDRIIMSAPPRVLEIGAIAKEFRLEYSLVRHYVRKWGPCTRRLTPDPRSPSPADSSHACLSFSSVAVSYTRRHLRSSFQDTQTPQSLGHGLGLDVPISLTNVPACVGYTADVLREGWT